VAIIDHVGIKAGMDCYDLGLYRALSKQTCETTIYSNFQSDEPRINKVFKFRVSENVVSFFRMLMTYRRIAGEISRENIQQCIIHGFRFGLAEWLLVKSLKKSSVKINMIVHDPESLLGLKQSKKWKERIFGICDAIIVHNDFSLVELVKELRDSESRKVSVIPHGHFIDTAVAPSDSALFKANNLLDKENKYLLFFGHIKKSKGLDLLLKSLARTDSKIYTVIAGRMRKHGFYEYLTLINKYNLSFRIKLFPGYISPEMRNELFQMADAVVLPYRRVFQSGVMLMALSYEKAIIASDLTPNTDMIEDGVNGFLFKTGDEDSLASAIERAMSNDAFRNEVAVAGRMYVEANHDWNQIASRWIKLFRK